LRATTPRVQRGLAACFARPAAATTHNHSTPGIAVGWLLTGLTSNPIGIGQPIGGS
jgi:hypothetical protein